MKPLAEYIRKRDFKATPEPVASPPARAAKRRSFVVQEHHASRLHYDFRLELGGVLKSWAVPKMPSPDPSEKRLAVEVEDHPLAYGKFSGEIPEDQYGAGEVFIWDDGTWSPEGDPDRSLKQGRLTFSLAGRRMHGRWSLVRMRNGERGKTHWLLFKLRDEYTGDRGGYEPIRAYGSRRERHAAPKAAKAAPPKAAAPAPEFIPPQLPLLVGAVPEGPEWIHEMKLDGYRIQAHVGKGQVRLYTRSARDWSAKFPWLTSALAKLRARSAVLDGEVVAMDARGRPDFQALQLALSSLSSKGDRLTYQAFDLLSLDGEDLREQPLTERKARLRTLLRSSRLRSVAYTDHIESRGKKFLDASCSEEMEGVVSKQARSPYVSGRSGLWVKTKCEKRQEFVIGGFTLPAGARKRLGAILLGVHDGGKLRYVGKCGTGFSRASLELVWDRLGALARPQAPFDGPVPRFAGVTWVKPSLAAEVSFASWTRDGLLRTPVFHGLREDKPAREIGREILERAPRPDARANLTHPDKILFAREKITKQRLAEYYSAVASLMLPYVAGRPLTLKRCPNGANGPCFIQRHPTKRGPAGGSGLVIRSAEGLLGLVQMDALEIHAGDAREPDLEHPDQIVMDLDPDEGLDFGKVKDAARELRETFRKLRLKSFVNVTGGKGLHVRVPLAPLYSWRQIKELTRTIAQEMAARRPSLYTANPAKAARRGKIYLDYLRNAQGASSIAPYSLRARETSSVALPIAWKELARLRSPSQFTLGQALGRIGRRACDPWKGFVGLRQEVGILGGTAAVKPPRKKRKGFASGAAIWK